MVQELLHDLVQLYRADGVEPSRLLLGSAADDVLAVLEQSIAEWAEQLCRWPCWIVPVQRDLQWMAAANRARALVVLGRCDTALAIWAELSEQEVDPPGGLC